MCNLKGKVLVMIDRIWLHIGAEKTGTTTLQKWLQANRAVLGNEDILFPKTPGAFNHIGLTAYALDDSKGMEEMRVTAGANKFASLDEFRANVRTGLRQEIESSSASEMVLSNEHCSSRLRSLEEIERLRDLLYEFCDRVNVLLYIREPVSFYNSWYSTVIASGGSQPFPTDLTPGFLRAADWQRMVQNWSAVFGSGAVQVHRFERSVLKSGDILEDFADKIGLPFEKMQSGDIQNESMGIKPLMFLRELNEDLPRILDGKFNSERGNIVEVLRGFAGGGKFSMPPEIAARITEHYKDSYNTLQRTYFPDLDGPLFGQPKVPAEPSSQDLTIDDTIALARHIWVSRNNT